ncbi:MAG: ferrous iron transport protein B [Crenarchaeota archaeon]|nr:ferrous iron transport protein B [Thermoproteota archaeon]
MSSRKALKTIRVVLVGQPNVGKSSLFNVLSGKTSRVSNWAGTTVEIKTGKIRYKDYVIELVDIPGIYSLTPSTVEERVAREYILREKADVYVVLVDTLSIERSLLLAVEILELKDSVIVALTKYDIAHRYGIHINAEGISKRLGVPVIPLSAYTGEGLQDLLETIIKTYKNKHQHKLLINYGELEETISRFRKCGEIVKNYLKIDVDARWVTIKLIEGDEEFLRILEEVDQNCYSEITSFRESYRKARGRYPEDDILDARRRVVQQVLEGNVVRADVAHLTMLSKIDKVFMRPILGPLVSLLMLSLIICSALIINMGFPANVILYIAGFRTLAESVEKFSISGILSTAFDYLASYLSNIIHYYYLGNLVGGIVKSMGAVLSLAPLVFTMAVILAIFEDSGLGARMAVALHSLMSKFGLSGRSIYPIMIGFGCNVPAVLASRTAIEYFERKQIALSVPLVPCQARLLVLLYMLTVLANLDPVTLFLSVSLVIGMGVTLCLLTSLMLRRMFKIRESPELLLEIPPIHAPKLRVVWWISWSTTKHFLEKAGTVIFISCFIIWMLLHYGPAGYVSDVSRSLAAQLGQIVGVLFHYLYDVPHSVVWKLGLSTIAGMIAKENIIAVLQLIGLKGLSVPQLLAFTMFTMLYMPCIPTMVAICREVGTRHAVAVTLYMFALAVVVTFLVYMFLSMKFI